MAEPTTTINLREFDWEFIDVSVLAVTQLNNIMDLLGILDMGRLTPLFLREGIDLPTLFFVTDEHLIQLGLTLSERIKLLRCIQILKDVPPPPASMAASFKRPEPPPPRLPVPRAIPMANEYKQEEKENEIQPEPEAEEEMNDVEEAVAEEEEIPAEEGLEPTDVEEKDIPPSEENDMAVEAAIAGAATAAAVGVVAAAAMASDDRKCEHSMVFLRSESQGPSEKYCTALQATFEDDLKAKQVAYVPSDSAEQVIKCLEVFLEKSTADDDLLWVVFTGSGTEEELMPGLAFQQLAQKIEACYRGRRVFIIVDTCSYPEFAEEDAENAPPKANEDLQVSLLYSVYPTSPNPCYLTLCLLDSVRGRIFARDPSLQQFTLKTFANEALDTLEFIGRCSETEIQTSYVSTPDFNDESLDVVPVDRVPPPKTIAVACGLRGIYEDRPVQIIDMNGPQRVQVRFLDEDCDTEWVNLSEVMVDASEDEEEEEGEGEGGRGRPLPVPPAIGSQSSLEESAIEHVQEEELVEEVEPALVAEEGVEAEEVQVEEMAVEEVAPLEEAVIEENAIAEEMQVEHVAVDAEEPLVEMEPVAHEEIHMEQPEEMEEPILDHEEAQIEQPVELEDVHMEEPAELLVEEEAHAEEMQHIEETPVVVDEEQSAREEEVQMAAIEEMPPIEELHVERRISTPGVVEVEEMVELEPMDEHLIMSTEEPQMEMLHEEIDLGDEGLMEEHELIEEIEPMEAEGHHQ